jgi:flagellar basal body-associated protein FliL
VRLFHSTRGWEHDRDSERGCKGVDILWILLIVILVLALLGFFSRGYW